MGHLSYKRVVGSCKYQWCRYTISWVQKENNFVMSSTVRLLNRKSIRAPKPKMDTVSVSNGVLSTVSVSNGVPI